jgi:hypothetical protein
MLEIKWFRAWALEMGDQVSILVLPFPVHALENDLASLSLSFILCEIGMIKAPCSCGFCKYSLR